MTESEDLPDWTNEVHVIIATAEEPSSIVDIGLASIIPLPKGDIEEKGTGIATNTSTYVSVVSRTITDEKTYHLAKITMPLTNAHLLKVIVAGTDIQRFYGSKEGSFVMFFIYGEITLLGDGSKKVDIQAKAVSTGETVYANMYGMEV